MSSKLVPLADAVRNNVKDGDTISLGGWIVARGAVAAVHEIIRQDKKGLTACQGLSGFDVDLLVGAGKVNRLITAGGSLDSFGRLNRINSLYAAGKVEVEENSALGMASRFLAGALGLPFMPIRSLLGSSILQGLEGAKSAAEIKSPFTGESVVLLRAVNANTAIVHVQRADEEGNAQISGPLWDTRQIVGAADKVLLTTEALVANSEIRKAPERTLIPGIKVASVSLVPFGSHPTSCYDLYDYDAEQLRAYVAASSDDASFEKYVQDNILAFDSFEGYLDARCPPSRRERLKAKPGRGY